MDETALKERFREATRRAAHRDACPSSQALSRLAAGALESPQKEEVLDHVTLCHDCAIEIRTALSLQEWSREAAGARRRRLGPWALSFGAAAAVAALALSLSLLAPNRDAPASRYRDGDGGAVSSLVSEDTPLARDSFLLRWSPAAEGSRYELRVTDENLHVLYRARELEEPQHLVPAAALRDVPSGARLLWQVEVRDPAGGRTSSPGFFARVR